MFYHFNRILNFFNLMTMSWICKIMNIQFINLANQTIFMWQINLKDCEYCFSFMPLTISSVMSSIMIDGSESTTLRRSRSMDSSQFFKCHLLKFFIVVFWTCWKTCEFYSEYWQITTSRKLRVLILLFSCFRQISPSRSSNVIKILECFYLDFIKRRFFWELTMVRTLRVTMITNSSVYFEALFHVCRNFLLSSQRSKFVILFLSYQQWITFWDHGSVVIFHDFIEGVTIFIKLENPAVCLVSIKKS